MVDIWEVSGGWARTASCGHLVVYKRKGNAKQMHNKGSMCRDCLRLPHNNPMFGKPNPFKGRKHSEETKRILGDKARAREISEDFKEQARINLRKVSNTRPAYDIWVEKFGVKEANHRREILREKQRINSTGERNPMYGKPSPKGAGVGWKGWYKDRFFRSLRELSFMVRNPDYLGAETKYWTAKYLDYAGNPRTTRPDFVCDYLKDVVECKPTKLHNTPSVNLKKEALEELCISRGYTYRMVDPALITKEEIISMVEEGEVRFIGDYENKLRRWNG